MPSVKSNNTSIKAEINRLTSSIQNTATRQQCDKHSIFYFFILFQAHKFTVADLKEKKEITRRCLCRLR